ncbi:MAG: hypothetical protein U0N43_08135 [Mediterraneibacter sp.]
MNTIFDKKHLPNMEKAVQNILNGRGYWNLAVSSERHLGLNSQYQIINLQLQKGAWMGDPWCMCELARNFLSIGNEFLPQALSWWQKAARMADAGAQWDINNRPILSLIHEYRTKDSAFSDFTVQCAMLSEFILTNLGITCWDRLSLEQKGARIQMLINEITDMLKLLPIVLKYENYPRVKGNPVRGSADPSTRVLQIANSVLDDFPDLITVIFHEIGHFVQFAILNQDELSKKLCDMFCFDKERVSTWFHHTYIPGYDGSIITTEEEDADTLSYNVQLAWISLFA